VGFVFSFDAVEGGTQRTLELMPLTVRRKLDEVGLKLSLEGWRALAHSDRQRLVAVSDDAFLAELRAVTERARVSLSPVRAPQPWRASEPPEVVVRAASELGARIDRAAWEALDHDARFTLHHLARPRAGRDSSDERLRLALVELGLLA
jgi:hypothetical protein